MRSSSSSKICIKHTIHAVTRLHTFHTMVAGCSLLYNLIQLIHAIFFTGLLNNQKLNIRVLTSNVAHGALDNRKLPGCIRSDERDCFLFPGPARTHQRALYASQPSYHPQTTHIMTFAISTKTCKIPSPNLQKPAKTCKNLPKPAKTCQNLPKPAKTCQNLPESARIRTHHAKTRQNTPESLFNLPEYARTF